MSEIINVARRKNITSDEFALQDYISDKILWIIGTLWLDTAILKGGTALYKFYGIPRFSKDIDIDFVYAKAKPTVINAIIEFLMNEGFNVELSSRLRKEPWYFYTLEVSAPLLPKTYISIDIKLSNTKPPSVVREYYPLYPDIFPFKISVADIKYIFEEKITAIMDLARYQIRDLYDLYYIKMRYGLDPLVLVDDPEKFCKIAKSMLRYSKTMEPLLLTEPPSPKKILATLGCE